MMSERHFTATAFIVDSKKRVLLLWHKRLQRWMPPGGHIEANETPEHAAKRECKEETGLDVEIIGDAQDNLFLDSADEGYMLKKPLAMLLEYIPESKERGQPAHEHMDFLFLAKPLDAEQAVTLAAEEAEEMRWFTMGDIDQLTSDVIYTNVKKYLSLFLMESDIK